MHLFSCLLTTEDPLSNLSQSFLELLYIHFLIICGVLLEDLNKIRHPRQHNRCFRLFDFVSTSNDVEISAKYHKLVHGKDVRFVLDTVECGIFTSSIRLLTVKVKDHFQS
jgi:hypothetical protein